MRRQSIILCLVFLENVAELKPPATRNKLCKKEKLNMNQLLFYSIRFVVLPKLYNFGQNELALIKLRLLMEYVTVFF